MDVFQIAVVGATRLGVVVWLANLVLLRQCVRRIPLLGNLWLAWLNLRSGFIGARAGGIRWRNTFYPSALLRSGIRVMWP